MSGSIEFYNYIKPSYQIEFNCAVPDKTNTENTPHRKVEGKVVADIPDKKNKVNEKALGARNLAEKIFSITPLGWMGCTHLKPGKPEGKITFPEDKCYTGAFVADISLEGQKDFDRKVQRLQEKILTYQNATGKHLAIVLGFEPWGGKIKGKPTFLPFPKKFCDIVHENGSIPFIKWEPWKFERDPGHILDEILSGRFDKDLENWFKSALSWGHPLLLSFAHEMNISDYPWCGNKNGGRLGGPKKYKAAWEHVYHIAEQVSIEHFEGKTNITWVWCPDAESQPDKDWNAIEKYYPGKEYVDCIGIDGYNFGVPEWREFIEVFGEAYNRLKGYEKPIIIAEFGSSENGIPAEGKTKDQWISQAFQTMSDSMPEVRGFVLFNIKKEEDWRAYSSKESLKAFWNSIKDPYFLGIVQGRTINWVTPKQPILPKPEETEAQRERREQDQKIKDKKQYFEIPKWLTHPLLEFHSREEIGGQQVKLRNYPQAVQEHKKLIEEAEPLKSWTYFYYEALVSLAETYINYYKIYKDKVKKMGAEDKMEGLEVKVYTPERRQRTLVLPGDAEKICQMILDDPKVDIGFKARAAVNLLVALEGDPDKIKEADQRFKIAYEYLEQREEKEKRDWHLWERAMKWWAEPKYRSSDLGIACSKTFDLKHPERSGALGIYNNLIETIEAEKPKDFDVYTLNEAKIQAADLEVRKGDKLFQDGKKVQSYQAYRRAERLYNEAYQDIKEEWGKEDEGLLTKIRIGLAEVLPRLSENPKRQEVAVKMFKTMKPEGAIRLFQLETQEESLKELKKVISWPYSDYHRARALIDIGEILLSLKLDLRKVEERKQIKDKAEDIRIICDKFFGGDNRLITEVIDEIVHEISLSQTGLTESNVILLKKVLEGKTFTGVFSQKGVNRGLLVLAMGVKALELLKKNSDAYLREKKGSKVMTMAYSIYLMEKEMK